MDARDLDNDIWVWDISRQKLTRLTFDSSQDVIPLWTKDSRRIIARFVLIREPPSTGVAGLVVVENWLEELKARVPTGK